MDPRPRWERGRRFAVIGQRISVISRRFGVISRRFGVTSERIAVISQRFGVISERITVISQRIAVISRRFGVTGGGAASPRSFPAGMLGAHNIQGCSKANASGLLEIPEGGRVTHLPYQRCLISSHQHLGGRRSTLSSLSSESQSPRLGALPCH